MMLSKRQQKGFVRLFRTLALYVADETDPEPPNAVASPEREDDRILSAVEDIWGADGGTFWIDEFVERNPGRFNRRDLEIVSSWKDAVATDFCVTRMGSDSVLLTEGYAFVVRGLFGEVHEVLGTPSLCWAVLLPFDGVITYGWGLAAAMSPDPVLPTLPDRGLGWYRERGRLIRGERQFLKVAPEVKEELSRRRAELETSGDPNETIDGQHRGVLAGIWGDERMDLIMDNIGNVEEAQRSFRTALRDGIASRCMPGAPIPSLEDVLMTETRDEIVQWAKWLHLRRYSSLRKAELAHVVAHYFVQDPRDVLEILQEHGKPGVEGARRVFEAGGRLDVRFQDIETFRDFPDLNHPVVNGYRLGDIAVAHIPDEVMGVLGDADWDAETRRADRIYRAERFLEALVSYRGMVEVNEAFALTIVEPGLADFTLSDFRTMSEHLLKQELIACTFVELTGDIEGTFAMDPLLVRESGISLSDEDRDPESELLLGEVMEAQRTIEPRPVTGMKPGDDALGLTMNPLTNPRAREVIEYLDEHVPDSQDGFGFADRVMEGVILMGWQHDFHPAHVRTALNYEGFQGTPAQVRHIEDLFSRLFDEMPRWRNNGWSDAEVDEHLIHFARS